MSGQQFRFKHVYNEVGECEHLDEVKKMLDEDYGISYKEKRKDTYHFRCGRKKCKMRGFAKWSIVDSKFSCLVSDIGHQYHKSRFKPYIDDLEALMVRKFAPHAFEQLLLTNEEFKILFQSLESDEKRVKVTTSMIQEVYARRSKRKKLMEQSNNPTTDVPHEVNTLTSQVPNDEVNDPTTQVPVEESNLTSQVPDDEGNNSNTRGPTNSTTHVPQEENNSTLQVDDESQSQPSLPLPLQSNMQSTQVGKGKKKKSRKRKRGK